MALGSIAIDKLESKSKAWWKNVGRKAVAGVFPRNNLLEIFVTFSHSLPHCARIEKHTHTQGGTGAESLGGNGDESSAESDEGDGEGDDDDDEDNAGDGQSEEMLSEEEQSKPTTKVFLFSLLLSHTVFH